MSQTWLSIKAPQGHVHRFNQNATLSLANTIYYYVKYAYLYTLMTFQVESHSAGQKLSGEALNHLGGSKPYSPGKILDFQSSETRFFSIWNEFRN